MKLVKIYFVFLFAGLLGCIQDRNTGTSNCQAEIIENHQFKSASGWTANFKICQHILANNQEAIIGYNFNEHKLQAFNLDSGDTLWQIPLKKEGPGMIPEVVSFYYHSPDSIFVLSFFYLSIINRHGDILKKYVINRSSSKINGNDQNESKLIYSDINHSSPIYYDDDEKAVYFAFKPLPPYSDNRFEQPLCGRFLLDSSKIESLPIFLPDDFKKQYFGAYERPTFLFNDDEIVYGFYLNGNLYQYSKKTGKTSSMSITVTSIGNTAPALPRSISDADPEFLEHLNTWPTFFRLTSDGEFYYRPFVSAFNKDLHQRKKYLLVYDGNLNPLREKQLPDDATVLSSNIALNQGSLFMKLNNDKEDLLNYIVVIPACNADN